MNSEPLQIVLAPLRGLTESLFRNTYAEHFGGVDWAVTPFLNTIGDGRIKPSHLKEVLAENNRRMPVVPQVIGSDAGQFIELCKALFALGYETVNWNLGCPFPRVAKKGRGSGLLDRPDRIDRFLERVIGAIPNRLSIKMRLGRRYPEEIHRLLPVLDRYPIEQIILHPRTGVQMYEGRPDRYLFETCLTLTRHVVIYNGDITCAEDLRQLRRRFPGLSTWMIGRGIIADPFLPERIKGIEKMDVPELERFRRFHDDLFQRFTMILMGPTHVVDRMKGYWTYFARSLSDGPAILKQIHKCRTADRYSAVVQRLWESPAQLNT